MVIFMLISLLLTLLTGLFFLIGIFITNKVKNKEKFTLFTMSLAFVVMLGLLLFDLLEELLETKNIYLIIPVLVGLFIFILLDKLIPHHEHHHQELHDNIKEHHEHLNHVGLITILALGIHNMLEGLTLYTISLNNYMSGILMMISISFHNIPLGFQIGSSIDKGKNKLLLIFLCLSSLLGALIIIIFGNLNELVASILLALTFGMLLYILIFELFNEIKTTFKKKETIYGIIIGIIILIITMIL